MSVAAGSTWSVLTEEYDGGPMMLSKTGSKMRPWNRPNTMTNVKTLKNVKKRYDFDNPSKPMLMKVLKPPFNTAGPISCSASVARWFLVPWLAINACAMWAEKSTHSPVEMMIRMLEIISMVSPQKCMNPITLTKLRRTQTMTITLPVKLANKIRVTVKTQATERAKFL